MRVPIVLTEGLLSQDIRAQQHSSCKHTQNATKRSGTAEREQIVKVHGKMQATREIHCMTLKHYSCFAFSI